MTQPPNPTNPTDSWLEPDRVFLVVGLLFGILFLIATPPTQAPDETWHFYRAYMLSEGKLTLEISPDGPRPSQILEYETPLGADLPASLNHISHTKIFHYSSYKHLFSVPLEPDKREFIAFDLMWNYPFLGYVPQALGILIGRILHLPLMAVFYLGRFANLIVWLLLVHAAIRIAPIFKWVIALVALAPVMLFQVASYSGDAALCAAALLTFAVALHYRYGPGETLGPKGWAALIALSVALALLKIVYLPLALLFLMIPPAKFGGPRKFAICILAAIGLSAAAMYWWQGVFAHILPHAPIMDAYDPAAQTQYVLENPFAYILAFLRTFRYNPSLARLFGRLGWLDLQLPEILVWGHLILLLAAAVLDRRKDIVIGWGVKVLLLISVALCMGGAGLILYIWNTPPENRVIWVLTDAGRYYIPILAPLLLVLYRIRADRRTIFAAGIAFLLAWSVFLTYRWYR